MFSIGGWQISSHRTNSEFKAAEISCCELPSRPPPPFLPTHPAGFSHIVSNSMLWRHPLSFIPHFAAHFPRGAISARLGAKCAFECCFPTTIVTCGCERAFWHHKTHHTEGTWKNKSPYLEYQWNHIFKTMQNILKWNKNLFSNLR